MLRRLASWIALAAIVAVTFMPTFTRLAAAATDLADVCSAEGARGTGPGDPGHRVLDHCPYCALHADLALLPPPRAADSQRLPAFSEFPVAFLRAPHANLVWSAAQPRAPPALA